MSDAALEKALGRAFYKPEKDGSVFASVPGIRGVFAIGATREEAEDELRAVLIDWMERREAEGVALPPTLR